MTDNDPLKTLLDQTLDSHLTSLLKEVNLTSFSRLPPQRLARTACTHISSTERVSGPTFRSHYQDLYESSFHGYERERSDLIISRLLDEFNDGRKGLAPYYIIGFRDHDGNSIGAAQFSILFLPGQRAIAVPYLQYIYVRSSHRRQDLSEVLHTLVLAVAMAEARKHWDRTVPAEIPFTLCETEPPTHGNDESARAAAKERAGIHSKSGSVALMLRDPERVERIVSAHVQPGLDGEDPPLTLIWILRANPVMKGIVLEDQQSGILLLEAYYNSLRDEGFAETNIRIAERLVEARRNQGYQEFCLIDIGDVKKGMYIGIDQNDAVSLSC